MDEILEVFHPDGFSMIVIPPFGPVTRKDYIRALETIGYKVLVRKTTPRDEVLKIMISSAPEDLDNSETVVEKIEKLDTDALARLLESVGIPTSVTGMLPNVKKKVVDSVKNLKV